MIAEQEAGSDCLVLTRDRRDADRKGVIAVVVERRDGSCAAYLRGSNESWPSIDEGRAAVERASAPIVWRETTPGVWTARPDGDQPLPVDRGSRHSRRADPTEPTRASTRADTYMAARILRGIVGSGRSSRAG